jgi:hypothetical protein
MNPEYVFHSLRGIMRWPNLTETKFLAGTNPIGVGMAWVKKYWITRDFPPNERERDKFFFVPARASDNPYKSAEYEDQLAGLSPALRKAYLEGSWDVYEGQFFPELDETIHVVNSFVIPAHWRKFRCMDHGRTAPSACLWLALDEMGGLWVYREYYKAGVDADVNARSIASLSAPDLEDSRYWFTVLDSQCWAKHGGETIAEIYERNGVPAEAAVKDKAGGFALIHEYLRRETPEAVYRAERKISPVAPLPDSVSLKDGFVVHVPRLRVFSSCVNLLRELKDAVVERKKDGSVVEDMDPRCSDHALDCLRYGLSHMHEARSLPVPSFIERLLKRQRMEHELSPATLGRYYAGRL